MNAHPYGDPQTVAIAHGADAAVVEVTWKVGAADDLTLLGIELGVLPEDRVMLDGAIAYDEGDAAAVAAADELHAYLLDHVEVAAGDAECVGEVASIGDDLIADGATLAFTCPAAVDTAAVTVTTLTDLHPAYRTLATGADGQRAVYETTAPTHEWALGTAPATASDTTSGAAGTDLGTSAALQLGAVLGVVLLAAVGGALVLRRRGRTTPPSTTP